MEEQRRVITVIDEELWFVFEKWRADQFSSNGKIPSMAEAARVLISRGLAVEGYYHQEE